MSKTSKNNTTNDLAVGQESRALSPARQYEDLSPAEKQAVEQLVTQLTDCSDAGLSKFSAGISNKSARASVDFLKSTKINDLGEFDTCMLDLSRNLRSIDTKELSVVNPSPTSKVPLIGGWLSKTKLAKKVDGVIEKQESIERVIKREIETLEGIKLTLAEDKTRCISIRKDTVQFAINLELFYFAYQQKRLALEQEYNDFVNSPSYNPANLHDSEHANELQDQMQALERKMDATLRSHANAISDIPTYSMIKAGENAIIDAIQDCIDNVVPEWEKSFAKAILSYRLNNAATVIKQTKEANGQIAVAAARLASQGLISAAEAIEAPSMATEALQEKNQIFLETIDRLVQISKEASERRIKDADVIRDEERKTLFANQQRKTAVLIEPVEGSDGND